MKTLIVFSTLCLLTLKCISQDDSQAKVSRTFSIDGAVCLTTDGSDAYYNMGGAQIKFDFNHTVVATLTLLPSLWISNPETTNTYGVKSRSINAAPVLGIGPQIIYKRIIFSFPFYYKTIKGIWVATAGIGYKIQYSKSK